MGNPRIGFHASAWGSDHLLAALHGLARCGFGGIEVYADVSHVFADRPEEFKDILEITGVPLAGIHSGGLLTNEEFHEAEELEWRRLLEWVKAAGGDYAIYYGGEGTGDADADTKRAAALLNRVGAIGLEVGVKLCYEPDRHCPFNSREGVARLMRETDPSLLSLSADTAHLEQMGFDPTMFLLTQKHRLGVVHIRDLRREDDDSISGDEFVDPGRGRIDLRGVADTLRMIRYDGWIVGVVDNPAESPLTSAQNTSHYFSGELDLEM